MKAVNKWGKNTIWVNMSSLSKTTQHNIFLKTPRLTDDDNRSRETCYVTVDVTT